MCRPRVLTPAQAETAVKRSLEVNPANAAGMRTVVRTPTGRRGGPRRLALLVESRWPRSGVELSVQFLDGESPALRKRILSHMNAWNRTANIRFRETNGTGLVRIARLKEPEEMAGYWSWVGTQILGIEEDQPTLNLEGFTMKTPESEFVRVVRHEAGHTLGFEHEHMRTDLVKMIDREKAFAFYDEDQGWDEQETIEQVLTPLAKKSIMGTKESDPLSIMCYQIPAEITIDGKEIPGGLDINANDFAFAAKMYPKKPGHPPKPPKMPKKFPAPDGSGNALKDAAVTAEAEAEVMTDVEVKAPAEEKTEGAASAGPGRTGFSAPAEGDTFHIVIMDAFNPGPPCDENGGKEDARGGDDGENTTKETPLYARIFASYGGARVTCPMRLRKAKKTDPPTAFGRIISMHERIKNYTNRESGTLPSGDEMMDFGADLFEALFQGDVRRLYDEARSRQQRRRLDLVLTSMISWIAEKPWEFAYDKARQSFLATEEIHLIRNVLTAVPASVIRERTGPLRILVAAAQPVGFVALSAEQEAGVIRRGFEALIEAKLVTVEVLARATPGRIHGLLSTGEFDVVHFIGHGTFNEETQEGALIFEDERGGQYPLGERSCREIFCQRGVSLVFLNACQTGSGGRSDFNKGVAQALVSHGLPALVANQYSVLDSSATSFAQHFYWSLAQGMGLGEAAREARIAVNYSMEGELIDWAVPVVYARDPAMRLCTPPPDAQKVRSTPARAVRAPSRRGSTGREVRVAVWDIEHSFAGLDSTLTQLNAVQQVFGFDLVDLSVPLDAWDVENKAPNGAPYLWAEKFATRVERMAMELRVDVLACITRHWLRDDNTLNLYGWWPEKKKPPVVLFSCAGFDDLPAAGLKTDRAITNALVAGLAGFLSGLGTHEKGAMDCPLAYNANRSLKHVTGPQKFDKSCRAQLKKVISGKLTALEGLLKAFP